MSSSLTGPSKFSTPQLRGFKFAIIYFMKRFQLNRKLHYSEIIGIFCISFLIGALIESNNRSMFFVDTSWIISCSILIIYALISKSSKSIVFAVLAGIIFGLWRSSLQVYNQESLAAYLNQTVIVGGIVADEVTVDGSMDKTFYLNNINIDNNKYRINLQATIRTSQEILKGDQVSISGKIINKYKNKYSLDGEIHGDIVRSEVLSIPSLVEKVFSENVNSVIDQPASSLGLGFLIGKKTGIQKDLIDVMKIAGLTHVIVASGYNLTILVRFCRRLFSRISKYVGLMSSVFLVLFFISIAGLGPSTFRAGLVTIFSLLALYYGRKFNPFVLISIVAAITVVFNPDYLSGDIGWILSFTSFFGVMIVAPMARAYFFGKEKVGFVMQLLTETSSAIIMTAPIIAYTFGYFSIISLIANIILLPLVPLSMLLVFIAGVGNIILRPIGLIVGHIGQFTLDLFISTANYLSTISWAQSKSEINIYGIAVYYLTLSILLTYAHIKTRIIYRNVNIVE